MRRMRNWRTASKRKTKARKTRMARNNETLTTISGSDERQLKSYDSF